VLANLTCKRVKDSDRVGAALKHVDELGSSPVGYVGRAENKEA